MESIKELRTICQKTIKTEDSVTMRYFVRYISIYITKICLILKIGPTAVLIFHTFLAILAGAMLGFNNYWLTLCAAIILLIAYILDAVDGEIARYKKMASINGKYLDSMSIHLAEPFVIAGLSIGVYLHYHSFIIIIIGFIGSISSLLIEMARIIRYDVVFELFRKAKKLGEYSHIKKTNTEDFTTLKQYNTLKKKLFYTYSILFNFRGFSFAILLGAIFNLKIIFLIYLIVFSTILPLITIARIHHEYKKGMERFIPYLKLEE